FHGFLSARPGGAFLFGRLLLVRAFEINAGSQHLLHHVGAAALRAFLRHGLVIRREVALGIIGAAPEDVAAPRLALGQISLAALGALHAFNKVLLHILALRIPGARNELAISALAKHQRLAAHRAIFA